MTDGRPRRVPELLLAAIPGLMVGLFAALIGALAGKPDALGSDGIYRVVMDVLALGRFAGMFGAGVLLVWGILRGRGASRAVLALALLSGPLTYAVTAYFAAARYYSPGEAAYYAFNSLTLASTATCISAAAIAEMLWRWRNKPEDASKRRAVTPGLALCAVGGLSAMFLMVLFHGGTDFFYIWEAGYKWLFNS